MPKIDNKRDSNYHYARNSSLITADVDNLVKRNMKKYQKILISILILISL